LQRAIFRNNADITKKLLAHGADCEYRIPNIELNMPLYAIMRDNGSLLDLMLETGASTDYNINEKPVATKLKNMSKEIDLVHFKHERWRRLRKWLALEELFPTKTSTSKQDIPTSENPLSGLNHNLRRTLI